MHKKCFFQIRSIEMPVMFLKMVIKKLFSLQNVMKKSFEMHYSLEKNCLQVPKIVTPPPPIKNNGPSLSFCYYLYDCSFSVVGK